MVGVGGDERGEEDPFGDLGAVDAGGGGERDGGLFVDGGRLDVVRTGGEEVDELWWREGRSVRRFRGVRGRIT